MKKSIGVEVGPNFIRAIVVGKIPLLTNHTFFSRNLESPNLHLTHSQLRGRIRIIKSLKEDWNWKDNQDLPDSLKEILSHGKSPIYLSIPKSITFFRKVSFPFKSRKKILLTIPYELEESLPLPMEKLNFDFSKLSQEKNRTQVIVVAVSKEIIKKILTPFEKIGVKISSLESSSSVLFNLGYSSIKKKENILLLNLEEKEAIFDIIQNKSLVESRSIQDKEELMKELLYAKKAFFGQGPLKGIFLVGSSSPALKNELKEKLNLPIIHLDLQKIFKISDSFNSEFSLALGLSLKGLIHFPLRINLITERKKVKRFLPKKNALIFPGILLFLLILILPFFNLRKKEAEYRLLKKEMKEISKAIFPPAYSLQGQAPALSRGGLPLPELKRRLKVNREGSEKLNLLLEKEKSPLETLKRISGIIPKDLRIEVKSMGIDRKGLAIVTSLSSLKEIDRLKEILQKSTYFEEVKIGDTRLNKEKDTIEFNLNLKIK